MTLVSFGQYLAIKREKLGLTREESARKMGVSMAAYGKWELGANLPSFKCLEKIKAFYNLTDEELEPFINETKKLESKPKHMPIYHLMQKAKHTVAFLEEHMTGDSTFERNIKNKAIDIMMEALEQLSTVRIIDEAF
jgi:transcriptional regulator with XRE-family HTH domain